MIYNFQLNDKNTEHGYKHEAYYVDYEAWC